MLHCANCVDFMQNMEVDSVDMTLTSPPYDDLRTYNGYDFDFEAIAKGLFRITKQGGVVVWVVADRTKDGDESGTSFRQALYFKEIGFKLFDTMIYAKKGSGGKRFNRYIPVFEYMFIFSKGKPKTTNFLMDRPNKHAGKLQGGQTLRDTKGELTSRKTKSVIPTHGKRTNIWEYTIGGGGTKDKIAHQHPAIFPEKLAQDHILSWTNPNDLVFDPMCGSGTTGKMALLNNRRFIGVDISQEYIDIATERLGLLVA